MKMVQYFSLLCLLSLGYSNIYSSLMGGITKSVGDVTQSAGRAVGDVTQSAGRAVGDVTQSAGRAAKSIINPGEEVVRRPSSTLYSK